MPWGSSAVNNSCWSGVGGSVKNSPSNNSNFKGISLPSSKQVAYQALEDAINMSKVSNKTKVAIDLFTTASTLLSEFLKNASGDDLEEAKKKKQDAENFKYTLEDMLRLQEDLNRQKDAVTPPSVGETLPAVLKQNTKSLVESVGTLTSTFGDRLDTLNECMYSFLKYMDTVTTVMQKSYDLSKGDSDQAKKDKEATTTVGDTKMTAKEIEVQKNLAMMKNYQFKTSPVDQSVLESDSVVGMSPLQIEVSHRSNEVEARVYQRTPTTVKDIDENVLFDMAPREANLVKNAVVAKDATDKINFELDDEDVDLGLPLDIKTIFGYSSDSDSLKEFYTRLGGTGL